MKAPSLLRLFAFVFAFMVAHGVGAESIVVRPDRDGGVYRVGETVAWTITWTDATKAAPAELDYVFKLGGLTEVATGKVGLVDGVASLESGIKEPNTMLLEVSWTEGGETLKERGGAVASPDEIKAAGEEPADFDAWWAEKIAELGAVPMNASLTAKDVGAEGVDYAQITMDHFRGSQIHGQVARPKQGDTFPALLRVQWAGVYGLQTGWVTERAEAGWLALNILPHDLPIDEAEAFYQTQRDGPLKDYFVQGNEDRETSYFLRMYLSCYRAVEYLKSRPDWDGRTLVVTGTSQGGQQTFVTAGLHPDVTAAMALVPAGADFNGDTVGRAVGFPFWPDMSKGKDQAAVAQTGGYFDIVNFARRVRCPMLVGVGLKDVVCPPAGIFAAMNQLKPYHELVILPASGHQDVEGSQRLFTDRMEQGWLPALQRGLTAPVALDRNQDHALLREQLGISKMRNGANPNDPDSPEKPNYDEAKAHPYPSLPDALIFNDGSKVRSASEWPRRRIELKEHFAREVYGRIPPNVPDVKWEVIETIEETKGGVAVLTKRLAGHVDNTAYPFLEVTLELRVSTPISATGPVPVVLHFGWPAWILARFPAPPGPTWDAQVLAHGWGAATLVPTSVQADNGEGLHQGIIGLTNHGQPRTPEQWGALRAWAWGASRALDYFETDADVDATRVSMEGLSRYGKAAAVAVAFDERFAVGFIGSSGKGGLAMHRRDFGERVENLTGPYAYHWMAGNYLKYGSLLNAGDLPVDSHELVALMAPRPVFVSVGSPDVEGQWIDQRGNFEAAVAAASVYELLGKRGLGTAEYPGTGPVLERGELAWRQHEGGHTTLPNWPTFLAWADRSIEAAQVD
jgi:cephalosporin-C deacetylase-like acetyl esterase